MSSWVRMQKHVPKNKPQRIEYLLLTQFRVFNQRRFTCLFPYFIARNKLQPFWVWNSPVRAKAHLCYQERLPSTTITETVTWTSIWHIHNLSVGWWGGGLYSNLDVDNGCNSNNSNNNKYLHDACHEPLMCSALSYPVVTYLILMAAQSSRSLEVK